MSDSMERDKLELLTTKETEEEEEQMKRELLDMKMYETWYTYKDMKEILCFINESKDMANTANDSKNAQKDLLQSSNDCISQVISKENLAQELEIQEHSNTSRSLLLHQSNHMSPEFHRISTHSHSSPEPVATITESRNSAYRGKNFDNEDTFDRLHDNLNTRDSHHQSANKYVLLKLKNTSQDPHTHNAETKVDTHSERDQKLERWQVNPLDSYTSKNDVPLQQPKRPLVQDRMPFRLCKDAQTPESLEKLVLALNIHLKQTTELWHSWQRTTDTKFQWGSPIQVGLAKGSLDKKTLTNIKAEENQMECTNKYDIERPNKRKSTVVLSSSNATHFNSDEDEKIVKKKKTLPQEGPSRILRSHKGASVITNEKDERSGNTNNISRTCNIESTKNFKAEHQKEECLSPELLSLYTRKIIPLNPLKNISNKKKYIINTPETENLTAHGSNMEESVTSDILTDEEILAELEKDKADGNIKMFDNTEIKPLPVTGLSRRIKNECMILEKIQIEKQKKLEILKEEARKKENERKRKREEFYRKQIEERQQREKQQEEKEKAREAKTRKWNSVVDAKLRKKIGEQSKEKLRGLREQNENKIIEITEENNLFQDNNRTSIIKKIESTRDNVGNNINCPICNQSFPSDKIETHAAECEQYITDNEDENNANLFESKITSKNVNNEVLECGVCLIYRTTNRAHYEEHVNNCQETQDQEESLPEYTSTEIDNILNSPVRCYRPISEQIDGNIDYRRQFPTNSKAQVHSSKKRKH
ncbi:histone-lysine N-methyltransferase, H3 lysine-79 specific-like [Colletes gigas]|uniref:histone-lysine N-methyltransferase, H3 lysine-79 specific-like n=1 Tax=Colletes gigas TaxID=935657 RepID=UPI001C9B55AF|nr:histone-lysine N-methyltransferase, H3 lysine-79 specific-like [Colletes gigas]